MFQKVYVKQKNNSKKSISKAVLLLLALLPMLFLYQFPVKAEGSYGMPLLAVNDATGKFPLADGAYSVSLDMSGGSGKASVTSPTLLTVEQGTPIARIQWSSANYDYMIVDSTYYYNQSEEGMNSVFEIPVLCWDETMEVIADTTAMGNPVEVHYQFLFYQDSIGSKNELPQEAAKRVLYVAFAIIIIGGLLNYILKKKNS